MKGWGLDGHWELWREFRGVRARCGTFHNRIEAEAARRRFDRLCKLNYEIVWVKAE